MAVLGVDIGGVIITQASKTDDTSFFSRNFLATPPLTGVFEGLAQLVRTKFGGSVHIVSKCSTSTQARSLEWLSHHRFYERTGISSQNVHFCRDRAGKATIAGELGVTHFVDNHPGVLGLLRTVQHRFLFQPEAQDLRQNPEHLDEFKTVWNWAEAVQAILAAR